jgi:hypothetical protein
MWFVLTDLAIIPFAIYGLLLGYRRIGKPPGVDANYDAWHQQWAFLWKLLGWGWIALSGFFFLGILVTHH